MKFNFKKVQQKRQQAKATERHRVLQFIQNHAAKADFINWLNANYKQQFAEDKEWDEIIKSVRANQDIHTTALHSYATTLTDEEDVNKLLKDVEKETEKAEETVSELYDAASAKKMQPIVGGACLLGGFLLLIAAAGLITDITELGLTEDIRIYLAAVAGLYGLLNVLSGLLLTLK